MPSSQKIIVTGHLAKDPELTYSPSGIAICKFSIPVQEYYDKQKDRTNWFSCVAVQKKAETIQQYLAAGDLVQVELKKNDSTWEKDGKKHYKTEFFVVDIVFLRVAYWEDQDQPGKEVEERTEPDDDIPF
jgi:single-strand DNA-binding protein